MKLITYISIFLLILSIEAQEVTPIDLNLPPVSTFEEDCARCHGSEGKNYGDGFAGLERKELGHVTEEMMHGPAFLEPTESDVKVMTAYQFAISKDEPFIAIINAGSFYNKTEEIIHLETSFDTKILESNDYEIEQSGKNYSYILRSISDRGKVIIKAERNGKVSTLSYPDKIWTHGK